MGGPRGATERRGAPRKLAERLNMAIPHWESAIFWWIFSKRSNILLPRRPPFPNTQMGKGDAKLPTKQRGAAGSRGALRNLTERLNFATPHWNPPYFGGFPPNYVIFFAANPPLFPNTNVGKGEMRNYRPNKGAPRNATERYGNRRVA